MSSVVISAFKPAVIFAVFFALPRITKAFVKPLVLLFAVMSVISVVSGCSQGDSTVTAGQDDGGIAVPAALLTLPQGGALTAYIQVDDGERQQMAINGENASISMTGITEGSHTFTIEFEYVYTDPLNNISNDPIILASASKTMIVVQGNNSLIILESDYDTASYDEDGDGESNLEEISAGNNPFASILVSQISGDTSEGGATATFSVNLTNLPTDDVTIAIQSLDPGEGQVDQDSITITPNNWLDPQTITVTGIDDDIIDGDVTYTIQLAAATSNDASYSGFDPDDVTVTNTDNDSAGFTVSPIMGNTTENGGTATLTIVLRSEPSAAVSIGVSSSNILEGIVDTDILTFDANNWGQQQTITITGIDDTLADGNQGYFVQFTAAMSTDSLYDGLTLADVAVTNIDNDSPGFNVSPINGVTSEGGMTASFTVALTSAPIAAVTVNFNSSDPSEGTTDVNSITFTTGNWNNSQTVTVTGMDDDMVDGDQEFAVQFAAAMSTDSQYDGLSLVDVTVTNIDNDSAGFNVSPISGDTTEGGVSATFSVALTSEPTADVTVGINSSDVDEGVADVVSITFTPGNWNNAQTVTVTGVDDSIIDGNQNYIIVLAQANSSDPNYAGLNPADVNVTNLDNDNATPPIVTNGSISISEINGTGMALSWSKASDSVFQLEELQYQVYFAKSDVLTTITNTEALGTLAQDWTSNIDFFAAKNLEGLTDYHWNIIVRNPAGLKALYSTATAKTYAAGIPNPNFNGTGRIEYGNQDGMDQFMRKMIEDNNGDYILVGSTSGTSSDLVLKKVSPAGELLFDTVHDDLGNETASDVTVDANNNIYVSGAKDQLMTVWRFDSQGNLDSNFGTNGRINHAGGIGQGNDNGSVVMIDNQNRIVVVGYSWNNGDYDIFVWRFTANGVLDTTNFAAPSGFFSIDGPVAGNGWDLAASAIIDSNNRIIVGGFFASGLLDNSSTDVDGVVLVLNSSGVLDSEFGGGNGYVILNEGVVSSDRVLDLAIDSDGFILGVGQTGLAGKTDMIIWSLDPVTGALNPGFNSGQGWLSHDGAGGLIDFSDSASGVTIDPRSNNIVIAGTTFAFVEVTPFLNQMTIWRLKPDGTFDTSFDNDGFATYFSTTHAEGNGLGNSVLIGADETIYIGGSTYGGENTDADFAIWNYK